MQLHCRLRAFTPQALQEALRFLETLAHRLGMPSPTRGALPQHRTRFILLRGPHVHKKAREYFERRHYGGWLTLSPTPLQARCVLHLLQHSHLPGVAWSLQLRWRDTLVL
jgi:ribosomal protein S10